MKIAKDLRVRTYELTYLVPASFSSDEIKQAADAVAKAITKHGGKILEVDDWGKRELSYGIKHGGSMQREAVYTLLTISLDANKVQTFEKDIYLMPEVMRHLLVIATETEGGEEREVQESADKEATKADQNKEKVDEKDKK